MCLVLLIFPAYISFGDFIVKSDKIVFDFTQQDSSYLADKIYYPINIGEYNEDQLLTVELNDSVLSKGYIHYTESGFDFVGDNKTSGKFYKRNDILYGILEFGDDKYSINIMSSNYFAVKVDSVDFKCGVVDTENFDTDLTSRINTTATNVLSGECKVRILAAYTPQAISDFNGKDNLIHAIKRAIETINSGFENSNVDIEFQLAKTYETQYVSSQDSALDLNRLANSDGIMDDVLQERINTNADLVMLFEEITSVCGIAYLNSSYVEGFSIVSTHYTWSCLLSSYAATHEIGHNYGCQHDKQSNQNQHYSYGHGYCGDPITLKRSVMAYRNHCNYRRINTFSNPDLFINNSPFGTYLVEDNARVLEERNNTINSFDDIKGWEIVNSIDVGNLDYIDISAYGVVETNSQNSVISPAHSEVDFRAYDEIRLKDGFHAEEATEFHAKIEALHCNSSNKLGLYEDYINPSIVHPITISPNPASQSIEVTFGGLIEGAEVTAYIVDIMGRRLADIYNGLQSRTNTLSQQVDISGYPAGTYSIVLQTGKQTYSEQFVKLD
jgi:hypothetical protein